MPFKKGHPGGPGRPLGSRGKFTLIKEEIAELWKEENGKERLRKLILEDKEFIKILKDVIIPILPRDPIVTNEINQQFTKVEYVWRKRIKKDDRDTVRADEVPGGNTRLPE